MPPSCCRTEPRRASTSVSVSVVASLCLAMGAFLLAQSPIRHPESLKAAIQNLPFEQRTALVLREVEGLKYEEIAFSLGLPVGTVKSRLTRARQALREELGDLRC